MKHLEQGLNKYEVVESILEGLSRVDIKTNLILCMMRGFSEEENLKTIAKLSTSKRLEKNDKKKDRNN